MSYIPAELRRLVIARAGGQCEYCHLSQAGQEATFHIDHIVPVSAGGQTVADNLALACVSCSLRKSARQFALDPQTGAEAPIYNPPGRATVEAFEMNRPLILAIRQEEIAYGRHPF